METLCNLLKLGETEGGGGGGSTPINPAYGDVLALSYDTTFEDSEGTVPAKTYYSEPFEVSELQFPTNTRAYGGTNYMFFANATGSWYDGYSLSSNISVGCDFSDDISFSSVTSVAVVSFTFYNDRYGYAQRTGTSTGNSANRITHGKYARLRVSFNNGMANHLKDLHVRAYMLRSKQLPED